MVSWTESGQFNNKSNEPRLSDMAEVVEFKKNKPRTLRLIGPARRMAIHWIEINKKAGGTTRIPRLCLAYDGDKGEFNGKCPYCEELGNRPRIQVITNVIDRDDQENPPKKQPKPTGKEKKQVEHFGEDMYLKTDKDSPTWTPIKLASLTPSVANKIVDLTETNKRKVKDGSKKKFGPDHRKFGFDIVIKYDPDREPANQYSVMRGDNTELSEEELEYLRWPLDLEQPKPLAEAKLDAKSLLKVLKDKPTDDDNEDSDKPSKSKGKKSKSDDFDDDDFDDEDDDNKHSKKSSKKSNKKRNEDDDEEEKPSRKHKTSSKNSSAYSDDDDNDIDDEDDDSDEEDDEDDKPRSKKGAKGSSKSKSKKSRKDDDDEDDDDDDEDDDDGWDD